MSEMNTCPDGHPASEQEVRQLDIPALLVVGTLRAWVAPLTNPGGDHPDWRQILTLAGVPGEAATSFHGMMELVAGHARRLIEVRCCQCPALGADEAHMLTLVATLQAGDAFTPVRILSDWLPPGLVAPALAAAQRFAGLLSAEGLRLPGPTRPAFLH